MNNNDISYLGQSSMTESLLQWLVQCDVDDQY